MTRQELAQARIDEIDALQIEIQKALVALEDPCEFCGVISACHPQGAKGKPVDRAVCVECEERAAQRLLEAKTEGEKNG